jgi:hypothetical protein
LKVMCYHNIISKLHALHGQQTRKRKEKIIEEVEECIESESCEIEKLQQDLNLFRRILRELRDENANYRSDSDYSKDISIEITPNQKVEANNNCCKQKSKKSERQEALEKARAWHLDRLREQRKRK